MSTEQVAPLTPETLTFAHIKAWTGDEMKKYMAGPLRQAIYDVIKTQSLEQVEAAAAEQTARDQAAAPQPTAEEQQATADAEAARIAAEQAEAARVAAAAAPKKIVLDYQVKDEDGNALGRPTHLEATSNEEMIEKMKEAHVQATRAFHRLKRQKVTIQQSQPATPVAPSMTDAELIEAAKDLKSDDPAKIVEAHRKIAKVEIDKQEANAAELRRQERVSQEFLANHKHDFNNCEANVNMVAGYFNEHKLPWTAANLEVAFEELESKLAPVVPVAPVPPANPAPVAPTPTAAPVVQPVVTVPAPAAALNPAPAAPRPGVNGGIVPGQNSGSRPAATPQGLTMAEIHSWDGPTMRNKMRNPQLRADIERVIAENQTGKRK